MLKPKNNEPRPKFTGSYKKKKKEACNAAYIMIRLPPGGGTPILKLYGDVPPFRVWFFDRPLISRVSNSKIFE